MLSILGRAGHLLRHPGFEVNQLDVIHTGPDRSFTEPSGFEVDQLDVIYTGSDRSFTASSGHLS